MSKPDKAVVVGRKPVLELLAGEKAQQIECVYIKRDLRSDVIPDVRRAANEHGIPMKFVPEGRLNRLSKQAVHQGLVAILAPVKIRPLSDVLSDIAATREETEQTKPLILLLDQVSDPHNLGAIVRSGLAFGCKGVILPARGSAHLGPAAIKASAGTALQMPFARIHGIRDAVQQLKERGYWLVGLESGGETDIADIDWNRPTVLIIGSEGQGLRKEVSLGCDSIASIPIEGVVESLNASVAAGVTLHTAARVRKQV